MGIKEEERRQIKVKRRLGSKRRSKLFKIKKKEN